MNHKNFGEEFMIAEPISALTNYNAVLNKVGTGQPLMLTKDGKDKYVVEDSEDYEHKAAYIRFLEEMYKANRPDTKYFTTNELRKELDL
jgi:hypothetical protein